MPTDTEVRDAWLTLAQYNEDKGREHLAAQQRTQAAEFEPKPAYPDGLYRSAYFGHVWQFDGEEWGSPTWRKTYTAFEVDFLIEQHGQLTPLRVLGDNQIAIDRSVIPSNDGFAVVEDALQTVCCPATAARFRSLQRALKIGGRS